MFKPVILKVLDFLGLRGVAHRFNHFLIVRGYGQRAADPRSRVRVAYRCCAGSPADGVPAETWAITWSLESAGDFDGPCIWGAERQGHATGASSRLRLFRRHASGVQRIRLDSRQLPLNPVSHAPLPEQRGCGVELREPGQGLVQGHADGRNPVSAQHRQGQHDHGGCASIPRPAMRWCFANRTCAVTRCSYSTTGARGRTRARSVRRKRSRNLSLRIRPYARSRFPPTFHQRVSSC